MDELITIARAKIEKRQLSPEQEAKWTDWKWQVKNTIRTIEQVEQILGINFNADEKRKISKTIEHFPMSITPYYLSLVDTNDYRHDPVIRS